MLSLVTSTIAYFVAAFFLKRRLDEVGIPKTMSRTLVIFAAALLVSYGVGVAVDWAVS